MAVHRKGGVLTTLMVMYSYVLRRNLHDDAPARILAYETEEVGAWTLSDSLEIYHINGLIFSLDWGWDGKGSESGSKPLTLFDAN